MVHINVTPLHPNTRYQIDVITQMRSNNRSSYSNSSSVSFATLPSVPSVLPETCSDCFTLPQNKQDNVTVYWKVCFTNIAN